MPERRDDLERPQIVGPGRGRVEDLVNNAELEGEKGREGWGSLGEDGVLDVREFEAAKDAAGLEYPIYVRAKESG